LGYVWCNCLHRCTACGACDAFIASRLTP